MDKFKFNGFDLQLFGTPSAENLMLGQGILFFDRFDFSTGVPVSTGARHLGNCSEFGLTISVEKLEKMTSMYSVRRVYKTLIKQGETTGKIKVDEYDPDNLALALMGDVSQFTRAAAITYNAAAPFLAAIPSQQNTYITLPEHYIDEATVVVKDSGTTTLALNTDYTVDAERGRIYVVPGGNLKQGTLVAPLKIEFAAPIVLAAAGRRKISIATVPKVEGKLIFVGDSTLGPSYYAEFWHTLLTPEGDMSMIGDELQSFTLNLSIFDKAPQHPLAPYYRILQIRG